MGKVKVEGKGVKSFEVELKEVSLSDREEIMNKIYDTELKKDFSFHLFIIRKGTEYSDEEINKFADAEIYAIVNKIVDNMSKKK